MVVSSSLFSSLFTNNYHHYYDPLKVFLIIVVILIVVQFVSFNHHHSQESFFILEGEMSYIKARDGNYYLVRNVSDKMKAANLLARVNSRVKSFILYLRNKYPNDREVARLYRYYNEHQLSESRPHSTETSYSINKGEKLVLCLREKNDKNSLIDINTIMFVTIHELAHLMANSVGHTDEFWNKMSWLLKEAIESPREIYQFVDYSSNPVRYCGITINDNVYTPPSS